MTDETLSVPTVRGEQPEVKKLGNNQNTGRTHCKRGHEFSPENTALSTRNGKQHRRCKTCSCQHTLKHYFKDHEKSKQLARQRSKARWSDPSYGRSVAYRKYGGMSLEDFQSRLEQQSNACAICGTSFIDLEPVVDHDHACCPGEKTCGKCTRGVLCRACNNGLGFFKDNIQLLQSAISYLQRSNSKIGELQHA
jgi:hypothetical protein